MGLDLSFRHDRWLDKLTASPKQEGMVHSIFRRPPEGGREPLNHCRVEPGRGLVGDKWEEDPERQEGTEVSLINVHLIRAIADGPRQWAEAGDQLVVDLDLSEANLPVGTRLAIGEAVIELSDVPHRPCEAFHARFGAKAAKRVARGCARGLRSRGAMCRVVEAGKIKPGSEVRVLRDG